MIGLEKDICHLSKHIYINGNKFNTSSSRLLSARWISPQLDDGDSSCIRTLFKLEGHEFDVLPPSSYIRARAILDASNSPDISDVWHIMDTTHRLMWARNKLQIAQSLLQQSNDEYQQKYFAPTSKVLKSLKPFRISNEIVNCADPVANTFVIDQNGFVCCPTYNRFGTRTGRMTIANGPRVLTARQETREFLKPIDQDHVLVSWDYSSLEARVALALANKPAQASEDPYEVIGKAIKIASREEAKNATFAAIYSDPTANDHINVKISLVRRVFKLGETFISLLNEQENNNGRVRNLYGRLIDVTGSNTLYNNYVQSTSADVVLLGFLALLDSILQLNVVPHFVLHDALFASVPKKYLNEFKMLGLKGVYVPKIDSVFPLKTSIVGESTKI